MELNSRILVLGATGLVGSAIVKKLTQQGYTHVYTSSSKELNLFDRKATIQLFDDLLPEYVFVAAAHVGGIKANNDNPVDFLSHNLLIQQNVFHAAVNIRQALKRLIFLGSSCIYPRNAPQPLKEEYLMRGILEDTNRAYAIAKIAGIEMVRAINKQYGTNWISVMPCNLYGDNDNYHPDHSHVIPGLIHRLHQKKLKHYHTFYYWGSGTPLREFLHADDLAECLVQLMPEHKYPLPNLINVGSGQEISIRDLAHKVAVTVGYKGKVVRSDDESMDGTPRKLLDCSLLKAILPNWKPKITLEEGLRRAYKDYLANHHQ